MDEKELKEIFEMLEQQGWKPMLCDTEVRLFFSRGGLFGNKGGLFGNKGALLGRACLMHLELKSNVLLVKNHIFVNLLGFVVKKS